MPYSVTNRRKQQPMTQMIARPAGPLRNHFALAAVITAVALSPVGSSSVAGEPGGTAVSPGAAAVSLAIPAAEFDHSRVLGLTKADCKKCHVSEVASWMKTVHFLSPEQRLYKYEGNTKKYADALGIGREELLSTSACADCHGTVALEAGKKKVIAGISCERCHGPAGGEDGWLNPHQSYHESMKIPREQETAEHKAARHKRMDDAGMIRSTNIYGLAKNCYGCHLIGNEKLVVAGHKAASTFDFVSWSDGEVRHNFFMDKNTNAAAPSLWMDTENGTAENRKRVKFVVGALVQLETALRRRATATNPAIIPQYGGIAAAANGKLAQINGVAGTPETFAVAALAGPLLGTLFVPMPTDKDTYTAAADKVAAQAQAFVKAHDGSKLAGLDALIQATPPHYSQQYKDKYGN